MSVCLFRLSPIVLLEFILLIMCQFLMLFGDIFCDTSAVIDALTSKSFKTFVSMFFFKCAIL